MNYEDMSDFEINSKVAMRLGRSVSSEHECIKTGACFILTSLAGVRVEFNPCNNPSDAWFIIASNDINLSKHKADDYWFAFVRAEDLGVSEFKCKDNNPLRAAMICFLKMKDAEK
ncbi:NinX [Vibrio phage 1.284.A._10N.286.55.A5]|nr:NinX [Vibrio phage 1.284.A._10N.286.55.A5]AUS01637.1 NinX [Vibrio phage 1.287.O._10N.286.55.C7]AUS01707.1 NinX [Vibrio phage 1.289.A._10N.286.55.E8]